MRDSPGTSLAGKVVLITGASSGIGLETSVRIAAMGARVVMVARDRTRGDAAVAAVKARSQSQSVELLMCDMSSMEQVRGLADDFRARHHRLDVLVNNAGSIKLQREVTADGLEWTFATNYLGHFLLTNLLLDLVRASAPARIVNVSSDAHRGASVDFDNLQYERGGYSLIGAYGRSKLAQVLFTRELARRLGRTGVTVNAVHPGAVSTPIWTAQRFPWYLRLPIAAAKALLMISAAQAADKVVFLATSPQVVEQTGGYYSKNQAVVPSATGRDSALAKRLWDESEKLVSRWLNA